MTKFFQPTQYPHTLKPAIVLVNTGSPDTVQISDVRNYLQQLFADPYMIPSLWKRLLLRYVISPLYAKKSARKYRKIHAELGFPLVYHTQNLALRLNEEFNYLGIDCDVFFAMRYGQPNLTQLVCQLTQEERDIFLVPLFPQYTPSTTASAIVCAQKAYPDMDYLPKLGYLPDFYQEPEYIDSIATQISQHWQKEGKTCMLLFSFHGVPQTWTRYQAQCEKTVELVAHALALDETQYRLVYQSRFGKDQWTGPELHDELIALAKKGIHEIDIICPGFICDNLETLYDIDRQAKRLFRQHGGRKLRRISCLNDHSFWVSNLARLIMRRFSLKNHHSAHFK